ncbi:MAG: TVP38/TMEM64 family protein [Synechococcales cyanobacterium C42_A2020_086]|jgi:uncharacterized membrane protein YdjX (TVP38/TMEM64 family)|nr:TVP38/TMEM64 family protein [Synechococcales cyanobacterium C42_A2020_086]
MRQLLSLPTQHGILRSLVILGFSGVIWTFTSHPALALDLVDGLHPQTVLQEGLEAIQNLGPVGVIAFIGLYSLATVAFLPGSLLTLGAGVIFGLLPGTLYALIGATLGATLAFLVGRYGARDWVAQKVAENPKFQAIDDAVRQSGFQIVLLTRLSPIFPFNLLNYAYGITGVSLRDYVLGCLGMIPGTLLYVYLGVLAGDLTQLGAAQSPPTSIQWAIRIVGFLATLAVTILITQIARRALASASVADGEKSD